MPSIVLLLHSAMIDLVASRLRENALDCTLAPPNGIRLTCEMGECGIEDTYFPGMTKTTCEKIVASLWGISHSFLVELLEGYNAGLLPCLPMQVKSKGSLHLHFGKPGQMLYFQVAGPEPRCNEGSGGCWVLFQARMDGDETYVMEELVVEDDQLLAIAHGILGQENIE